MSPPPFTLSIFIVGFVLSLIASELNFRNPEKYNCHQGHGGDYYIVGWCAIIASEKLEPNIFILVLLPPLIYESAAKIEWFIFRRDFNSIMYLAFPGVVMSAGLIALIFIVSVNGLFEHPNWTMNQAFTLGSILAATDPVAVVGALHALGAPLALSTVIEGESLMNDGSAMVLFSIFSKMGFHGETYTIAQGIGEFAKLAIGGAAVGLGAFLCLHTWLRWSAKHWLECTLVVLLVVYGCFFVCEVMFGVSGILSVVVVGLGMGRIGKYSIPPEAAHSLEAVMHAIGAIAESAIFFFSGIVANVAFKNLKVFSSENWSGGGDIHNHILVLFILFITIHVVRLISILIGLPILKSNNGLFGKGRDGTSYGLRDKELFVILMSGLRGAVGLALATILVQEHSTSSHKETLQVLDELFFYVAGVTVLTLMLNGTLISPFYDWLNVYPELRQKMLDRGSSMKSIVRGIEHDMEKQWEKKSKHDHLFKEISENQEDLRELMYMVPRFDRFIITSTGHLKMGKQVNSLAHIRGLLPKTAARFKDQRGTYEATSSTSFSLDGWKDMQEHTTMLEKEYIYLESTHRVETHEASLDQANSLRAADTFSPPISPLSQKKSSPFSLSSSPSFTGTLSKSSSKDKKKLDNKEETPILEEETKDVNNKPRNSVANDDDDQGVQNEKFGQLTDGKGMGLSLRSASNAAIVSNTMSVSPTSCSLKIARLDQTYVTLVFTALDRLYKQQYETHELTENALVELDLARHEAVMLYEQKLVTLQAMSHTEYDQVLEKNQTSNIKINGAPARSRLSMMLVNMHKKQADAILERCLITELESMVASLPDPLALHRFILQLGVFGRILYAFCPPLRWILSYFCFGRVYQCVEILTGYIRAHEDLPGFIAHMDNEDGGRLEGGLKQRISNIQKAVSTVAKGKLELLGKAFPEAVHLTKLTMCAQVFAHMKLGAIHAIQQKGMLAEHDVDVLKEPVATALDDMFHCKDSFKMRVLVNESLSYHIFDDSSWLGQCFISKPKNNSSSSSSSSSSHDIESASSVKTEKWETELVKRNDRSNSSSSVGSNLGIPLGTEL